MKAVCVAGGGQTLTLVYRHYECNGTLVDRLAINGLKYVSCSLVCNLSLLLYEYTTPTPPAIWDLSHVCWELRGKSLMMKIYTKTWEVPDDLHGKEV